MLFTKDHVSIGRDEENDVVVRDPAVSGRHATIERRRDAFILRDAHSANGVWVGGQRVDVHTLRDGDVVSLGRASMVFKAGFSGDDLTLFRPPIIDGKRGRRPVIFVPGLCGSELWLGSERIFPSPRIILSNPEIMSLPGDPRIEARKIVSDVVIIPGLVKQREYSRLGDYMEKSLGYTRGNDLIEFAYDWRRDIRLTAQRLAERVESWGVAEPITIIAHSLGTLVTRYYVERLGGSRYVERIILLGGPHYGTPKGLLVILVGPGLLPFGIGDEPLRRALSTIPTCYQILPIYPCVFDQDGRQIDILQDDTWLPEAQRPHLALAREFRRELGNRSSVPAVSIFGYGYRTSVRVKINRRPTGEWARVEFADEIGGDLAIPAGSAVLQHSEIHPVYQEHGALYIDDDVKMRLKVELTRSTTSQKR
jgi:pimeloyl-ACP methyl ester carboxylesterase